MLCDHMGDAQIERHGSVSVKVMQVSVYHLRLDPSLGVRRLIWVAK